MASSSCCWRSNKDPPGAASRPHNLPPRLQRAMSPSLPAIVAVSLALGVRHAFEPDHLALLGGSHAHTHERWDERRALGFGLLHGLAGSGAIVALLIVTVPTAGLKLAYVAAFGAGTVLGMLAVSLTLVSVIRIASHRGERWATVMHLGSAVASVAVGTLLVGRIVTAL